MTDVAIKIENLGKLYRLGEVGTGTISHDLNRWYARIRGKEDPFAKIGESNDRAVKGDSDYVWALRNIDAEIKKGDVVGIIGRNGAGKSTLLKLLSKVTKPSDGNIKIQGRIASLLEVGTGFHPEMTGRENIFLNGAIMGMTKQEIKSKFDEIVDFAGVERYVDTPVKRYSSGMYVRLAFAVAAHLEPEILIVDEVLAVGDAEFQKKCVGKMKDVSVNEGRTVLFVSHNLAAVGALCNKGIVLEKGRLHYDGEIKGALDAYITLGNDANNVYISESPKENDIRQIKVLNPNNELASNFYFNEDVIIRMVFSISDEYIDYTEIGIKVTDQKERVVFTSQKPITQFNITKAGEYELICKIPSGYLVPNSYKVLCALHVPNKVILALKEDAVSFTIEETGTDFYVYSGSDYGCVFIDCEWNKV